MHEHDRSAAEKYLLDNYYLHLNSQRRTMNSIKNFILNAQIKQNSEKSETVSLVQYMNMNNEFLNQGKNQPNCDSIMTTRIPYKKLKKAKNSAKTSK